MKTKFNKKSIAVTLTAIALSSGAFLGGSLLLSQKADAQYISNCLFYEDGDKIKDCRMYHKYECRMRFTSINKDGELVTIDVLCLGKPIDGSDNNSGNGNDHLIDNPSIIP